jgi:hypothetical protein
MSNGHRGSSFAHAGWAAGAPQSESTDDEFAFLTQAIE